MPKLLHRSLVALALLLALTPLHAQSTPPFDLIIRNGHIIDGTGSALVFRRYRHSQRTHRRHWLFGRAQAKRTIDAHGMVVAPGFIDMLGPVRADDPGRSA